MLRLLFATCSPEKAEPLLLTLLEEKLVGCGNIIPSVASRYWWDGKIQRDEEVVMLLETTAELVDDVTTRFRELHTAEVPKIIVIEPMSAGADYMAWLRSVTR